MDVTSIKVLLAVRSRMISDCLSACLQSGAIDVVASATDGRDALGLASVVKPDVVVLDATLVPLPLSEVARTLAELPTRVVLLSSGWGALRELEEAHPHVHGFVPLTEPARVLIETVTRVARGERVIPKGRARSATIVAPAGELVRLGRKQLQVLELVAQGYSSEEIAEQLRISVRTVDNHRATIMRKLGVRHVVRLVRAAIRAGLVNP